MRFHFTPDAWLRTTTMAVPAGTSMAMASSMGLHTGASNGVPDFYQESRSHMDAYKSMVSRAPRHCRFSGQVISDPSEVAVAAVFTQDHETPVWHLCSTQIFESSATPSAAEAQAAGVSVDTLNSHTRKVDYYVCVDGTTPTILRPRAT